MISCSRQGPGHQLLRPDGDLPPLSVGLQFLFQVQVGLHKEQTVVMATVVLKLLVLLLVLEPRKHMAAAAAAVGHGGA
eukprot:1752459-Rhodomonas_salina.1